MTCISKLGLAIFFCALPLNALAGDITKTSGQADFEWKSTDCRKPVAPLISAQESKDERLIQYARDVDSYIMCLQNEAQRDFEEAQIAMQKAIETKLSTETQTMNDMMLQVTKSLR